VADVYDVLTSQRPYKAPLLQEAARERILQGSGTSFDPAVVRAFVHLLDSNPHFTLPQRPAAKKNGPGHGLQFPSLLNIS
jgi:putative two-component system response regulator